uniref:Ion_trans_2 domain-containing protein n=1 Tax=Wuchereria bancrofti TaxID=6293 RepID=A0A1I8EIQ2_WUCBA
MYRTKRNELSRQEKERSYIFSGAVMKLKNEEGNNKNNNIVLQEKINTKRVKQKLILCREHFDNKYIFIKKKKCYYWNNLISMLQYLLPFFNRFLISHSLSSSHLKHFRCVSVHCWLLLYVIIYAFGGGLVFYELEYEASKFHWNEQIDKKNLCIILRKLKDYSDETVKHLERCWKADIDKTKEWNYITSTLYGFGTITTLGCNHVAPSTIAGRLFSIIYGILGIP